MGRSTRLQSFLDQCEAPRGCSADEYDRIRAPFITHARSVCVDRLRDEMLPGSPRSNRAGDRLCDPGPLLWAEMMTRGGVTPPPAADEPNAVRSRSLRCRLEWGWRPDARLCLATPSHLDRCRLFGRLPAAALASPRSSRKGRSIWRALAHAPRRPYQGWICARHRRPR